MKIIFSPLAAAAALLLPSATAFAQSTEQPERVGVACLLALGRAPSPDEVREWTGWGKLSVSELIARHREKLQADAAVKRATLVKACQDAFGRDPDEREFDAWSGGSRTYTELMKQHVQWLADHPDDYRQVIERAYRLVLHRAAYSVEFDYWKSRTARPSAMLAGCIENWARRNAPGLMATTGVPAVSINSDYLTTLRLSTAIAREARAAAGLDLAGDADLAAARGCHVVAPGAGDIVSVGGIHFVAIGGGALRRDGNGN
jgi:hypothetical protein